MTQLQGIDVSRWQGIINWDEVKKAKQFAIIKLGGSDDGLYPDGQGVRNANEARRVGIPHGFYFYLGGVTDTSREIQHIKNLIGSIGGLRAGESLWLDWEEHNSVEVQYVYEIAKGLIDAGFPIPGIYMSLSRVKANDWSKVINLNCGLWVAAWGNNDAAPDANEVPGSHGWPVWAIWQYSSTGTVPGIGGRVDLNIFSGDVNALNKYGAGGVIDAPTQTPIIEASAIVSKTEYIVQSGDSLSVIAAKYGMSWQQLWEYNRDRVSNPNMIFAGQKLRVGNDKPIPAPTSRTYTVAPGDSLSAIGAKLGVNWQDLFNNNRNIIGDNPNLIKPGQMLRY